MTPIQQEMAQAILKSEARRDRRGHLAVYDLPSGDGGGSVEVAGINDRYHPDECHKLISLISHGKYDEAERLAEQVMIDYTAVVPTWGKMSAGVEFYLRDSAFNRGPTGAVRILQIALGIHEDGRVGPVTRGALASADQADLLDRLRKARQKYEYRFRDEDSKFWRGLVNRWNDALATSRRLDKETATA